MQKYRCQTARGLAHGLIEKIESYLEPLAYPVTTLPEFSAHVFARWELEFDEPPTNQIETFIAYCWGQVDRQAFYLQFSAYNFEAELAQYLYTVSVQGDFCGNEMNDFVLLAACQDAIPEIMAVSYFVDAAKYLSYDGVRYWFRDVYRMRDWGYCDECGSIEELEMCIYSFPVCWDFTLGRGDWEFYWADSGGCTNPYTDEATGIVARWDECSELVSLGARLQLGGAEVTSVSFVSQATSLQPKTIRFHAFVGSTWVQFFTDTYTDTTEQTHTASAPIGASAINVTISVDDINAEITAKSVSISGNGSANWAGNGCT